MKLLKKGEVLLNKDLTKDEVSQWIEEEWNQLELAGARYNEMCSIIIDGYIGWMQKKEENRAFVYEKLANKKRVDY